jgi:hypothetical protein
MGRITHVPLLELNSSVPIKRALISIDPRNAGGSYYELLDVISVSKLIRCSLILIVVHSTEREYLTTKQVSLIN